MVNMFTLWRHLSNHPPMTQIDPTKSCLTLINVFTVRPERCDELLRVLETATRDVMRHVDGFLTANLHRSGDGTRVVNYAQWVSESHFRAMLNSPEAREHMGRAAAIAESYDANTYSVAYTEVRG